MNPSWRPPPLPPIPGNNTSICPICSISHFPFCPPPPPPFIENPRFHYSQPHNDYYHQRPHFDHHHPPPPFPNHQSSPNYYNYVARRPTWYGSNPRSDMIPYDGVEGNYNNHPRGGVASASYGYDGYDNVGIKRAKIEITDNIRAPRGSFMGAAEVTDTARVPIDNERILKLIHDHGNVSNGHERLAETCEAGVDMGLKRKRETSEFSSMNKGSLDYNRYSNQLSPTADAMQHHLQPNHSCQPPYNWSESKGYYGGPVEVGHGYGGQPPLPASPSPPLPTDPLRNHFFEQIASPPTKKPSLFPFAVSSSADSAVHGNHSSTQVYHRNNSGRHGSILSSTEDFHSLQPSSEKHVRDIQPFPLQNLSSDEPNIIDASRIFKQPHRASRPDHMVIILRGLPGSGKSYLAKLLRDIEVENGGEAPRIHSMDEYFMTEVEKAEESELSKGSLRGKRQVTKTVMEYCYEPEMEEAYRASMLKAFKKTLDEGVYSFIIVDDRNLRVADFAQYWATAKRSGYEVYLVEASYKDPAGCAARNVHNFTLNDIQKMAGQWEEAPSLYLKMDIKSLLHGDGFDESGIQEVDMDMEDEDAVDASQKSVIKSPQNDIKNRVDDFTPHDAGEEKDVKHPTEEVNHLSRSKWSTDLDASGSHETEGGKGKNSSLSGIIQAYSKEGKSVSWGDQGGNVGFSISATRKTNTRSLIIGPGAGYNLKLNPLSEEEYLNPARNSVELKNQNVFQERIRAERESFKAVFDKRRQRIGGFNVDEE